MSFSMTANAVSNGGHPGSVHFNSMTDIEISGLEN